MKILKFKLSGQFAFFKNPEVNSVLYFTFNNIHKIALMGILGSILGLKGYNQQGESEYPEFYEKLRDLKVSIVPNGNVCPSKKVQVFNNSTMFFNKGEGGAGANLVVKEEWIENPSWDIYVQINEDNLIEKELMSRVLESRYVYIPYLGKNDHFANITEVEIFEDKEVNLITDKSFKLNSLYVKGDYETSDDNDNVNLIYREYLPNKLNRETNHYEYIVMEYSSESVEPKDSSIQSYSINGINVSFI